MHEFSKLFEPRSVAIIGASATPGKGGYIILSSIIQHKFAGKIYPVNTKESEILGLKAYPNLKKIPGEVDLVIVCVPSLYVKDVLKECIVKKVSIALLITAGFADAGEEGEKIQKEITAIAKKGGLRLIGPNSIGIANPFNGLVASLVPFPTWKKGTIAFAAQSGVLAGSITQYAMEEEDFGCGKTIGLGNSADLDSVDMIDYFLDDKKTSTLGLYIETIRDVDRLIKAASKFARKKPLVMAKSGSTGRGAFAASCHTGSKRVNERLVKKVFKLSGAVRASGWTELFDFTKTFDREPLPKGPRVGIMTLSGASGVLATDAVVKSKLVMAPLTAKTEKIIKDKVYLSWQKFNHLAPIDIWASLLGKDAEFVQETTLKTLMRDETVDSVLAVLLAVGPAVFDPKRVFSEARAIDPEKPLVAAVLGDAGLTRDWLHKLNEANITAFGTLAATERAVQALSALYLRRLYLNDVSKEIRTE
ncbi:MAG: CoA-binding protein [Thaumarchaeota archaeon]|nr:CoA-binding protein [Nitrososphaerota archaeon]MCZ6725080.1 CoA-binding protein [Nitrososphaerota archaeon]